MKVLHWSRAMLAMLLLSLLAACGASTAPSGSSSAPAGAGEKKTYQNLVVGFAQIGAESEWRTANTLSIQETAKSLGVELKFSDAQQKQENQIKAIRSFIAQKVDVIGVSPVVETGWETVFKEVKDAGIPLILLDRHADVSDDLFDAFIGSDFRLEGERACNEMANLLGQKGRIVELEGTVGSAPALDRKAGFAECLKQYPEMEIIASQSGDFTRAKGKEVMEAFLKARGGDIDAVYAHNDDMALGAIQAIEEAGYEPGEDILVVSIDGVKPAFEAMVAGSLNATVECNPLLGPMAFDAIERILAGETVERKIVVKDRLFEQADAAAELPNRKY